MKKILLFLFLQCTTHGSHLAAAGAVTTEPDQWTISLEELKRPIRHEDGLKSLLLLTAQQVASNHDLFSQIDHLPDDIKEIVARYWHERNIKKIYTDEIEKLQRTIIPLTFKTMHAPQIDAHGNLIAKTGPSTVTLYEIPDTATTVITQKDIACHKQNMKDILPLPNGDFATSGEDKTIKTWNGITGELKKIFQGHTAAIRDITYMPNGDLISGSNDKTVRIWDDATEQTKYVLQEPHEVSGVIVLSNNTIITRSYSKQARVWNIEENKLLIDQQNVDTIKDLKNGNVFFMFNNPSLAPAVVRGVVQNHNRVHKGEIYNWSTGELKHSFHEQEGFVFFAIAPNNDILAIKMNNTLHVFDSNTYRLKNVMDIQEHIGDFQIEHCKYIDAHTLFIASSKVTSAPYTHTRKKIILDLQSMQVKYTVGENGFLKELSTGEIAIKNAPKKIDIFDPNTGLVKYTVPFNLVVQSILSLPNGDFIAQTSEGLNICHVGDMHKKLFQNPQAITLATLQAIDSKIKSQEKPVSKKRSTSSNKKSAKRVHS